MNPTRFRGTVLTTEFVPKLDENLSSARQCNMAVRALRLRLSVTHAQPETESPEGEWYKIREPGYPDIIVDQLVGYTPGQIHLWAGPEESRYGGSYNFDLEAATEVWVWSPNDTPKVKYISYNCPRRSSRETGSRVLHQFTYPNVFQRVEQSLALAPPNVEKCVMPLPLPLPV